MIHPREFVNLCVSYGIDFWTGVPCSYLGPLLAAAEVDSRIKYVMATSEGEATGIAAGAYLGGRKTLLFCQNSGLGNMVNPITSLNHPYAIPALLLVSRRGGPEDEPQHSLMGSITTELLDTIRVPWRLLKPDCNSASECIKWATETMEASRLPVSLVMDKGTYSPLECTEQCVVGPALQSEPAGGFSVPKSHRQSRSNAIRAIALSFTGNEAVIATTGKIWRELLSTGQRGSYFCVLGSMGCAGAIGLGVHEAREPWPVIVLDGDGAALMKLGAMSTIGRVGPRQLVHVILDNEVYETTGGQHNASSTTDFATVALACGYRRAWRADVEDLAYVMGEARREAYGPTLVHVKVSPLSDAHMPKLTTPLPQHARRFSRWLSESRRESSEEVPH